MASEHRAPQRLVGEEVGDGQVRIYDTDNDDAWIRSDTTMAISWQV